MKITRSDKGTLIFWAFLIALYVDRYGIILFIFGLLWKILLAGIATAVVIFFFFSAQLAVFAYELAHKPHRTKLESELLTIIHASLYLHGHMIQYLTRYFPFSLLYTDRLTHAKNRKLREFIRDVEKYGDAVHMPFTIRNGELDSPLTTLTATITGKPNSTKEKFLEQLERKLQEKYNVIYIRNDRRGFRILVPYEMISTT